MNTLQKHAKRALAGAAAGWMLGTVMCWRLPAPDAIKNPLFDQPTQHEAPQPEFHFSYKGEDIRVVPVAQYRIAGLIVSHNDPDVWYRFDITHDSKSLNTRDLCLIWGDNLKNGEYEKVSFHNDDYTCQWRYGSGVMRWKDEDVSNNHLITANDDIRRRINSLTIGDQVVITGRLASYSESRWGPTAPLRQTSMRRNDTGNGACEIILVEGLEVIASHNWIWATLKRACGWVMLAIVGVQVAIFLIPRNRKNRQKTLVRPERWGIHDK